MNLLCLLTALALPPQSREIVLEIYNAATPATAALCAQAGWNTLVVSNREHLDLCASLGLRGVYAGLPHSATGFETSVVQQAVAEVREHPALAGYILVDEPDLRHWEFPPETLHAMVDTVRAADPDPAHPTMVTLSGFYGPRLPLAYQGAVDVVRLDPYPFFYGRSLAWPVALIDAIRTASDGTKPVWLIQQAWSNDARFPDPVFDRCLSYLALIHGVSGISHYAYLFSDRGMVQTLPEHEPAFWQGLVQTTGELARLRRIDPAPAGCTVRVRASREELAWAVWGWQEHALVVFCNPSLGSTEVIWQPEIFSDPVQDWHSGHTIKPETDGAFHVLLEPYGVRVFDLGVYPPPPGHGHNTPMTAEIAALPWVFQLPQVEVPSGLTARPGKPFVFSPRVRAHSHACRSATVVLDLPQGWKAEPECAQPVRWSDDDQVGHVAWRIVPPREYGRQEGQITVSCGGRRWVEPIACRVPLLAGTAEQEAGAWPTEAVWQAGPSLQAGTPDSGHTAEVRLVVTPHALYLRCHVEDKAHLPNLGEGGTWRGDGLQLAICRRFDPRAIPQPGDEGLLNLGIACDPQQTEAWIDIGCIPDRLSRDQVLTTVRSRTRRAENRTSYEVAIPWSLLDADAGAAYNSALRNDLLLSLLINDYDKTDPDGRPSLAERQWLEYGSGIVRGSDPWHYADVEIIPAAVR